MLYMKIIFVTIFISFGLLVGAAGLTGTFGIWGIEKTDGAWINLFLNFPTLMYMTYVIFKKDEDGMSLQSV